MHITKIYSLLFSPAISESKIEVSDQTLMRVYTDKRCQTVLAGVFL